MAPQTVDLDIEFQTVLTPSNLVSLNPPLVATLPMNPLVDTASLAPSLYRKAPSD